MSISKSTAEVSSKDMFRMDSFADILIEDFLRHRQLSGTKVFIAPREIMSARDQLAGLGARCVELPEASPQALNAIDPASCDGMMVGSHLEAFLHAPREFQHQLESLQQCLGSDGWLFWLLHWQSNSVISAAACDELIREVTTVGQASGLLVYQLDGLPNSHPLKLPQGPALLFTRGLPLSLPTLEASEAHAKARRLVREEFQAAESASLAKAEHQQLQQHESEINPQAEASDILILQLLEEERVVDLVEVSCGGGRFARILHNYRPDCAYRGVDDDQQLVQRAKKRLRGTPYRFKSGSPVSSSWVKEAKECLLLHQGELQMAQSVLKRLPRNSRFLWVWSSEGPDDELASGKMLATLSELLKGCRILRVPCLKEEPGQWLVTGFRRHRRRLRDRLPS